MAYYHSRYGSQQKKKRPKWVKFIFWILFLFIIGASVAGYYLYQTVYSNNVWIAEGETTSIYIPSEADYEFVKQELYGKGIIVNRNSFEWLAARKKYPELVKPGHYMIRKDMNNDELINMLRLGQQVPVHVTFNNVRTKEMLAQIIASQIEADSASIMNILSDSAYFSAIGLNTEQAATVVIPNTYEFYWNTSAQQFMDRMLKEYNAFWDGNRDDKAAGMELSRAEVSILASIVQKETNKNDEKGAIAGVYMNRLQRNWLLQADPTLVYASGDFGLKRVLNVHKEIDSPYNTYMYGGLPPGPICIPSIASLDAVLNYDKSDYFFFCAKDDFSGYHVFAKSMTQHNRNARRYHNALKNRK
jgi:UPF0755 protein